KNGISLYAAHLPLDAHPDIGHNALLADMVNLKHRYSFMEYCGSDIGCAGVLHEPCFPARLADKLEKELNCKAKIFGSRDKELTKVGIVSGGGEMDALMASIGAGADCLITGEMTHTMYHFVKESGIVVIALGHYRSETPGVLAVMDKVKKKFDMDCEFIDIPTGL
ncbi:MAG: Nif3-like dinuclear metal center hexameric protein, partial [Victivallaceae bacterium]|nr:Nif3-like dinuclear metal center hexameric protein [Victivallaceae bacterium]